MAMDDPTSRQTVEMHGKAATAVVDRVTDTIEIKIIQEEARLEALRKLQDPYWTRGIIIGLAVALLITAGTLGYTLYKGKQITPVNTNGWLYGDSSQVIYLVNLPGIGGDRTVEGVIFMNYINDKGKVVDDYQKIHVTISNASLTILSENTTFYASGSYQGAQLNLRIGPHDTVPIFTPYSFTPASDTEYTADMQRL